MASSLVREMKGKASVTGCSKASDLPRVLLYHVELWDDGCLLDTYDSGMTNELKRLKVPIGWWKKSDDSTGFDYSDNGSCFQRPESVVRASKQGGSRGR